MTFDVFWCVCRCQRYFFAKIWAPRGCFQKNTQKHPKLHKKTHNLPKIQGFIHPEPELFWSLSQIRYLKWNCAKNNQKTPKNTQKLEKIGKNTQKQAKTPKKHRKNTEKWPWWPPKIQKLSKTPNFANPILKMLLESQNTRFSKMWCDITFFFKVLANR